MDIFDRFRAKSQDRKAARAEAARTLAAAIACSGGEPDPGFAELEKDLIQLFAELGATSNAQTIKTIRPLYLRAVEEIPQERRMHWLLALSDMAERQVLSMSPLLPFLFADNDEQVVATAALHAAGAWHEDDGLAGVRELVTWAQKFAERGDGKGAAALFGGLLSMGDRRVVECVGECWRLLSDSDANTLAGLLVTCHAGVIDWLVSWLEQCEGAQFGTAAAALVNAVRRETCRDVIDVRRAMPVWTSPPEQVITVLGRWSVREYGERIRPRLLQIAADEQSPRIMHDVLKYWGIDYRRRHVPGVAMRTEHLRSVPPVVLKPTAGPSRLLSKWHPLQDSDFLLSEGTLLLCWGIFNPYGPTWSCVGLLPTVEPDVQAMFYRMLNPFAQQSGIVGVVHKADLDTGATVGSMIETLFRQEVMEATTGVRVSMISGSLPDVVEILWEDTAFAEGVLRAFLESPAVRRIDVAQVIRDMQDFPGQPWERTAMQRDELFARFREQGILPLPTFDGKISSDTMNEWATRVSAACPPFDGETSSDTVKEWFTRVREEGHWMGELVHFPSAWHGAIDHAEELAQTAYTYWQLDAFLVPYGYTRLRELADIHATEQAAREQAS